MNECIYTNDKSRNNCSILDINRCVPERCIWRKSTEEYLESLHKARLNYIATHGVDEYIKHVPNAWKDRFIAYEDQRLHDKAMKAAAIMAEINGNMAENDIENIDLKV